MKRDDIENYIRNKYNGYDENEIHSFMCDNNISLYNLIRLLFNIINDTNFEIDSRIVYKCSDLISNIYNKEILTEHENNKIKNFIKKSKNKMLDFLDHSDIVDIKYSYDKLEELIESKETALEIILKELIDKHESIDLIKNIIKIDKSQIKNRNSRLFDYVFNKELEVIDTYNYLNNYYIFLLRLFYYHGIDKTKYLNKLNKHNTPNNYEIYNIIYGNNKCLTRDEILNKYNKNIVTSDLTFPIYSNPDTESTDKIFTIDSSNSVLRDDAISIKKDGCNYIIKIYVADVPSYISFDSIQDDNAFELHKNSYLKNYGIDIYSKETSSKISLLKNKCRKTIVLNLIFDSSFLLKDYFLSNEIIRINDNLKFDYADSLLHAKHSKTYTQELILLNNISSNYSMNNEKYLKFKSSNKQYPENNSSKIIAEFNRLYNSIIASIMHDSNLSYIYRAQNKPYLKQLYLDNTDKIDQYLLEQLDAVYLSAFYTCNSLPHYGQGNIIYSHSSSPLRRYVDGYNQRLLHKYYFKDIDFDDSNLIFLTNCFNSLERETNLFEEEFNKKSLEYNKHNI